MESEEFNEVVHSLVALGYTEPLSELSLPLVDKLLADYLLVAENLKQTHREKASLHEEVEQLKADRQELNRKSDNVDRWKVAVSDGDERDSTSSLAAVRRENGDLCFLVTQLRNQLSDMEHRLYALQRNQPEPSTAITFHGELRPSSSGIGSGSEFGSSVLRQQQQQQQDCVPTKSGNTGSVLSVARATPAPSVQPLDLLSAAERRISSLEEELQRSEQHGIKVEASLNASLEKLRVRDVDIAALRRQLASIECIDKSGAIATKSHAICDRTGCDTVPVRLSSCRTTPAAADEGGGGAKEGAPATGIRKKLSYAELKRQNTSLQRQLDEAVEGQHEAMQRCLRLAADNEASARQIDHERERAERFHRELHDLNSIAQTMQLEKCSADVATLTDFSPVETVSVSVQTSPCSPPSDLSSDDTSPTVIPPPLLPAPICHTCSALEQRLEQLMAQLMTSPNSGSSRDSRTCRTADQHHHQQQQQQVVVDELEKQLEAASQRSEERNVQNQQLRQQLDDALRAIHRMSETITGENIAGTSSESTSSPRHPHRLFSPGDSFVPSSDIGDLQLRLKMATESHLLDRQRLESRLGELETLLEDSEREKSALSAHVETSSAQSRSLEAQVSSLQKQLRLCQAEVTKLSCHKDRVRNAVNQNENTLKSCEAELIQTSQRLEKQKSLSGDLQRRCTLLGKQVDQLTSQLQKSSATVSKLVTERDTIQNELDNKVVLLDQQRCQLEQQHDKIVNQESQVTQLKSLTSESRAQRAACDQSRLEVLDQLRDARAQLSAQASERALLEQRNGQLQSDLAACTAQVQRLQLRETETEKQHEQLQNQVREYVSEVARVEELLTERDEQRDDLLRQYRDLSIEATGLEETNVSLNSDLASLRAELSASQKELQHANQVISELNQRLETCSVAKQISENSSEQLQGTLSDLSRRLEVSQSECGRLQRELGSSRDLSVRLDSDKDKYVKQVAEKEAQLQNLHGELESAQSELAAVRQLLRSERSSSGELQSLLVDSRQRQHDSQTETSRRDAQLHELRATCHQLQNQVETLRADNARLQRQLEDSGTSLARAQRQLTDERFDRQRLTHSVTSRLTPPIAPPRQQTTTSQPTPLTDYTSRVSPLGSRHLLTSHPDTGVPRVHVSDYHDVTGFNPV